MNFKFISKKTLEGIRYKLVADEQVNNYVQEIAKNEWSGKDFVEYGDDLSKSKWTLQIVPLERIKPNASLLRTREFQEDLAPRLEKIRETLNQGEAIPPLILRGSDFLIFDGYARYQILQERNIRKCLAYVSNYHGL